MLKATKRMDEAEPLMPAGDFPILFQFTRATGYTHPNLKGGIDNYVALLEAMGIAKEDILGKLKELAPDFSWGKKEQV